MKNILIIVANPKVDSFSFAMANKYKELALKENYQVEILDLYRDKKQDFLQYESMNNMPISEETKYYQAKISKADELVFVFPYWWGNYPAILKNFIDCNFTGGFAFKYVDSRPVGLLKGKKVKVFTTTGAPYEYYESTGVYSRLEAMFKDQLVNFCGMEMESFNAFGGISTSKRDSEEILKKIKL